MPTLSEAFAEYLRQKPAYTSGKLCHAADTAMYFGQDGRVHACCYNRTQTFGRYPDQTVAEIWRSTVRASMAQTMTRTCLADGCRPCEAQIKAGNYGGLLADVYDKALSKPMFWRWGQRARTGKMPTTLHFELSNICNLECTMCSGFFSSSIRKNRENLPALPQLYDSAFVQQLRPYLPGLNVVKFFGGEPFLIPIYHEIWDALCDLNPRAEIQITTNGTVYNEKIKRYLDKLNTYIIVSIDSFVKETYETIRINAKYERVMENLMQFQTHARSRGKHISVAVCPITTNATEIPDMVRFCNEKGMRIFFNTVSYPFELCIKNLPVSDIAAILQAYEEAVFGEIAPEDTIAQENLGAFGSLIAQVRAWKQMAEVLENLHYSPEMIAALEAFTPSLQSPMADALLALHQHLLTEKAPDMGKMHQLHTQASSPGDHAASYMETLAALTAQSHFLSREQNERFQSAIQRLLVCCEQEQKWEELAAVTLRVLPDKVVITLLKMSDSNPLLIFAALKQL